MKFNRRPFTPARWRRLARRFAADAYANHMASHRGVWHVEDIDVLVIYSNHPYAHEPLRREWELGLLLRKLAAAGIPQLGRASFPEGGPDDGYSVAFVIDAGGDQHSLVARLYEECIDEAARPTKEDRAEPPGGRGSR